MTCLLGSATQPAWAKNRDADDFPDYNRLEYAAPFPTPDQAVAVPKPGSISMRVGAGEDSRELPTVDATFIPVVPIPKAEDESEPSMAAILDDPASIASSQAAANLPHP